MEEKSIFEMILDKELESEIIYEDEDIFSIRDINPIAPVHLLICLLYTSDAADE